MRVASLQFAPVRGDVAHNMTRADRILRKVDKTKPKDFKYDLLVLPKMAFTGSKFSSFEKLDHFLEPAGAGTTSLWALTTARKYRCAVAVGYTQRANIAACTRATGVQYFTSSIMVDAEGETLANNTGRDSDVRDEAFSDCTVPNVGRVSIGIFTDLDEKEFSNPSETEAFAHHMLASDTYVGIISMAWETREKLGKFFGEQCKPDVEALSCWVNRLEPLISAKREKETFIVLCNRSGLLDDATYAGTSAVLGIKDEEVLVYGLLGRGVDELLVVDTSSGPLNRLRPLRNEKKHPKGELENVYSDDAASSQAEPLTTDTSYHEPFPVQGCLRRHTQYEEDILHEQNAFSEVAMCISAVTQGPSLAAKKQARPKLLIPESPCNPPRELPMGGHRVHAAAISKFNASTSTVRSPTASTPHPNGTHGHWRKPHMSRKYTFRTFRTTIPTTPMTPFEDPVTAISPSVQCWDGEWSPRTPDGDSLYSTGQSSAADTTASDFDSLPGSNPRELEKPQSPKLGNVKIPALEPHNEKADCGTIPVLASPSIMATSSQTDCSSSERRGRRREQRQPSKKESRSSSRDSTRNVLLHRRVKRNDVGDVSRVDDQRLQSSNNRRPGDSTRSLSLPATRSGQGREVKGAQSPMARRVGFYSWPLSKEKLQRARAEIHEPL